MERVLVVVAWLCLWGNARANGVAVKATSSSELRIEAVALELISASEVRPYRSGPAPADSPGVVAADLDASLLIDLRQVGVHWLVSTRVVTGKTDTQQTSMVPAGAFSEAREAIRAAAKKFQVEPTIKSLALAEIWPLARTLMLTRDGDLQTKWVDELVCASPTTSLRVAVAQPQLASLARDAASRQHSGWLTAAYVTGAGAVAKEIASTKPDPMALVVQQVLTMDVTNASATLATVGPSPTNAWLRAVIAYQRLDTNAIATTMRDLATQWPAAAVAVAAHQQRLTPDVVSTLWPAMESGSRACRTRAGLLAAEAGQIQGLEHVSVAHVAEADLPRLDRLLASARPKDAARLRAELAIRSGTGVADAMTIYGSACTDDDCHLQYARYLRSVGRLKEAATIFGTIKRPDEQAEALLAQGQLSEALAVVLDPGLKAVIEARQAEQLGDAANAQARLQSARTGAPAFPVSTLSKVGTPNDPTVRFGVQKKSTDLSTEAGDEAPDVELSQIAVGQRALTEMLRGLPRSVLPRGVRVRLATMPWDPLWSFRQSDHARLLEATKAWLETERNAVVTISPIEFDDIFDVNPPRPLPAAQALSALNDADALVVVAVRHSDAGPRAHAIAMRRLGDESQLATTTAILDREDMIAIDRPKVFLVGLFGLLLVSIVMFYVIRGFGAITVHVTNDPDGTDEAFCLLVSARDARPLVTDAKNFSTTVKAKGYTKGSRDSALISPRTMFRLPPGDWHVHLYGCYKRAGTETILGDAYSRRVELRRGRSEVVSFDLTPALAELRISVQAKRLRGSSVWLDDDKAKAVATDDGGEARLHAKVGTHTLHVVADGHALQRSIVVGAPRIERIEVNVEREVRLLNMDLRIPGSELNAERPTHHEPVAVQARPAATPKPTHPDLVDIEASPFAPGETSAAVAQLRQALSPAPTSVLAPSRSGDPTLLVGRYRILRELGRGAMGVVLHARDEKLERDVALKQISPELAAVPAAVELFQTEAKSLAQIQHGNIVSLFDVVDQAGEMLLVMEFVDGRTLENVLDDKGTLSGQQTARLTDQLCAGLAFAHEMRVIHRDIKPANIFISKKGVVKLGDFGLARVVREAAIRRTEARGTPLYMAPEQITGTNVSHRTDLYAVGATMFHMVTGRPPFIDGEVLYHHVNTVPPRASTLVKIDSRLDDLIDDLLQKDSDRRPADANTIRQRLAPLLA